MDYFSERYKKIIEDKKQLRQDMLSYMNEVYEDMGYCPLEFNPVYVDTVVPGGERMAVNIITRDEYGHILIQDIIGYKMIPDMIALDDFCRLFEEFKKKYKKKDNEDKVEALQKG